MPIKQSASQSREGDVTHLAATATALSPKYLHLAHEPKAKTACAVKVFGTKFPLNVSFLYHMLPLCRKTTASLGEAWIFY
jgi:hypothetical protein